MAKPLPIDYPGYWHTYIKLVPEENLAEAFNKQTPIMRSFFSSISEEKSNFRYAPDKWTIKEVLQHVIDSERIFGYRALSFARKEQAHLPGFEENDYEKNSNANSRSWQSLANEFLIVRQSTHSLFNSFTDEMLASDGIANNLKLNVTGFGFLLIGHFYHHKKIVEERYK